MPVRLRADQFNHEFEGFGWSDTDIAMTRFAGQEKEANVGAAVPALELWQSVLTRVDSVALARRPKRALAAPLHGSLRLSPGGLPSDTGIGGWPEPKRMPVLATRGLYQQLRQPPLCKEPRASAPLLGCRIWTASQTGTGRGNCFCPADRGSGPRTESAASTWAVLSLQGRLLPAVSTTAGTGSSMSVWERGKARRRAAQTSF